jgi:hypothetical protein
MALSLDVRRRGISIAAGGYVNERGRTVGEYDNFNALQARLPTETTSSRGTQSSVSVEMAENVNYDGHGHAASRERFSTSDGRNEARSSFGNQLATPLAR